MCRPNSATCPAHDLTITSIVWWPLLLICFASLLMAPCRTLTATLATLGVTWLWPGVSRGSTKPVNSSAMMTMLDVTKTNLLCTGNGMF